MTSLPVWAVIIANFSVDWGLYTILICIPKYFVEILKFDIAKVRNVSIYFKFFSLFSGISEYRKNILFDISKDSYEDKGDV